MNATSQQVEFLIESDEARGISLHTYCKNCGKHSGVYVLKGVPAKGRSIACENCECAIDL